MENENSREPALTKEKLISLGKYAIEALEDPDNEIDIRSDMLAALKKEVTFTSRHAGAIPQDDPELNKIVSYFTRQKEIVDEVVSRPHLKMDIEFSVKYITSNQKRVNEILSNTGK